MSDQTPTVPAATDILRLTDVQVRIAGSHILQGIDLTVADGGVTALGTNIVLMGLVSVWAGWGVFALARAVLPRRAGRVAAAAAIGAFLSVPAAALTFVGLFVVGGAVPVPVGTLVAAMTGVHALIGVGEAIITALVVSAVVRVRPDLVHGAGHPAAPTPAAP